jgi:putative SOS response-associated peptidase YedK
MPILLLPEHEDRRVEPPVTDPAEVLGCLGPYPAERMTGYPVSTAVNAVANDGPALVEPLPSG